jgi:transposase
MWTMPRTKEISEDLRFRMVDLHKAGKGYKSISRSLDVHQSMERQIGESSALLLLSQGVVVLQRWLQEHSAECSMRLRRILECQLKTYRNLLEHANISVDESTISKTLNKNGVHGRTPRKKPQHSKKKHYCMSEVLKKSTWMFHRYILWWD